MNLMDYELVQESDINGTVYDSGVIVKDFDPTSFAPPAEGDLLFLTSGDISISDNVDTLDLGAEINGIHFEYAELRVVTGKPAATVTVTGASFGLNDVKRALGAADIDSQNSNKIVTRLYFKPTDYENITLLLRRTDGTWIACVMNKALSTGGLAITTRKRGVGTNALTFTAFRSINDKTKGEIDYYFFPGSANDITITGQPQNVDTTAGTASSFTVTATGATSYQWQVQTPTDVGFVNISGETSATLSLAAADVTVDASGNRYRCKLTSSSGAAYTVPAMLTVSAGV